MFPCINIHDRPKNLELGKLWKSKTNVCKGHSVSDTACMLYCCALFSKPKKTKYKTQDKKFVCGK